VEPRRRSLNRWLGVAALIFFVVAQLVIHNNARFVDQCFAADITTSTNLARNISTRWRGQVTGRSGLLARMPRPLPTLDPARLRLADGRPINVLILLTESLRADGLGMYGSTRPTSPFLDSLVEQNPDRTFKFDHATANASRTFLSMPSLLSGIAPYQPARYLHTQPLIWEYFRAMGAETFLITSQSHDWRQMKNFFDLAGIDHLYNREVAGEARGNEMGIDDRFPLEDFTSWLDGRDPTRPFTGVLQFNGTHYPYTVDDSLQLFGTATERDRYDNSIRRLDERLRAVFDALHAHDLEENTLVLLTSDHGEEFREHGYLGHVQSYYRTTLWIPMFWIVPEPLQQKLLSPEESVALAANRSLNVSNLDIVPTLLDFFDLSDLPGISEICKNHLGGSHLTRLDPDRIVIACNNSEINRLPTGLSVITGHQHYILNITDEHPDKEELYDWRDDTAELTNRMSAADPLLREQIYSELVRHRVCRWLLDLSGVDYRSYLPSDLSSPTP
jgi:glucan phosphoethanolaminetransferase (alkaline phosphatase superfamily)